MGLCIYTFPAGSFLALEAVLKSNLFDVRRTTRKGELRVRGHFASASVRDFTENTERDVCFAVVSGRGGLLRAICSWPVDIWLVRKVEA